MPLHNVYRIVRLDIMEKVSARAVYKVIIIIIIICCFGR
jgi:hypothetical protein